LEAFEYSAPFDPSVMVYFHKRLPESVVNDCNEPIIHHGFAVLYSTVTQDLITHKPPQPSTPALSRVCNSRPLWQFDPSSLSAQNAC
jgi:hypothetical protein